jgi:Gpi18-like mannosyltransferase
LHRHALQKACASILPVLLLTSVLTQSSAGSCYCCCFLQLLFAGADILAAWQIWRIGLLQQASQARCFWSIMLWLYNPFTVTISTRGSCDSIATVLLLAVLLLLMQGQRLLPALLYGLAVHFRIYPIVYAPAIVLYLAHRQNQQQEGMQQSTARSKVRSSVICCTVSTCADAHNQAGFISCII